MESALLLKIDKSNGDVVWNYVYSNSSLSWDSFADLSITPSDGTNGTC